ncbi:MAG TPA: deoxyribonuclease IV, partial [Candidatus Marinimicrobia bacterium]|nr:deoxyribonuclease IV [Candidatus Neomarinimicrobiota bacterium]
MRLGAHVSVAGGLQNAIPWALEIEADTFQMFSKNQRQWIAKPLTDEEIEGFKTPLAKTDLGPLMIHDSYLINMGSPDETKGKRAQVAFLEEYRRCEALGVAYLNFHPGSHTHPKKDMRDDKQTRNEALGRIADHMNKTLGETKGYDSKLVIENAAGQGTNVGIKFEEIKHIIDHIDDKKRVGVCIDTQHAWASGYDWRNDFDQIWDDFESIVGMEYLVALHLNDSKSDLGSRVDRHDNIGMGKLGKETFKSFMQEKRLEYL